MNLCSCLMFQCHHKNCKTSFTRTNNMYRHMKVQYLRYFTYCYVKSHNVTKVKIGAKSIFFVYRLYMRISAPISASTGDAKRNTRTARLVKRIFSNDFDRGFFGLFFYVPYLTLFHLPPLRFHCVGGSKKI
jgi:hypothetical protein